MKTFTKTTAFLFILFIWITSSIAQTKTIAKDDPINRVIYETNRLVDPATGKIPKNIRKKEMKFAMQLPSGNLKALNASGWINRGPFNVGGRTRALAIDIKDENIILAGGVSGGMWRSTDGGTAWTKVTSPDQLHSITGIAQDPRDGHTNIWYYITGEYTGNSADATGAYYQGDGIFKSTDNGQSWTQLTNTMSNTPQSFDSYFDYCWNIQVSPTNGYVYAAIYGVIARSIDGGATWKEMFNSYRDTDYSRYTDIAISSTGVPYITASSDGDKVGFYKSNNNGMLWIDITPAGFPTDYGRTVLDIARSNENILYFLTHVSGEDAAGHNLWKYNDDTNIWTNLSTKIPDETGTHGSFDSQGGYDLIVKVKPDDENFVIIGGTDLWRSTDGFATTNNYTKIGGYLATNNSSAVYSNQHPDQHSLVFYPSNLNKVISGHDGGLSYTDDITKSTVENNDETVVWSSLNTGYLTTQSFTVAIDMENQGDNMILSGFMDNGTWLAQNTSGSIDWERNGSGDGSYCAFGNNGNSRYTSWQNGTVYRYWNSSNWTRIDPDGAEDQSFINPFILDPNNTNMMYYLGGDVIWRNSDLTEIAVYSNEPTSTNWDKMTNTTVSESSIKALDVSTTPANILYFATNNSKVYKVEGANTGDPAKEDISSDNFPDANIGCIKINPNDTSEIMISFTNYSVISIWHTNDGGMNWQSISGNLEEYPNGYGNGPSVRWVELLQKNNSDKIYFAGTSTGLYSTTNLNGDNTVWTQESPDMIGNIVVDMIKVREDGTVAIGTHGNGVYSAQYDVSTAIQQKTISDNVHAKIYPNPTNGIFTIEIQDEIPSDYLIVIYNMKGQPIYFSKERNVTGLQQIINLQKHAKGIYNIEVFKNEYVYSYKILLK